VPFLLFLKSFEELLYEMMSWVIFYPRTLWRSGRHPLQMMRRGEREMELPREDQFRDILSPPIFLLLTVLVTHAFEMALVGNSRLIDNDTGLTGLIQDNTSLILFRIVAFATLPVIAAAFALRVFGRPVDRGTLQPVFYGQCFATTPVLLLYSVGGTVARLTTKAGDLTLDALLIASTIFYLCVEACWFQREARRGWAFSAFCALAMLAMCVLTLTVTSLLFAGFN
jgi:hypothetical protein